MESEGKFSTYEEPPYARRLSRLVRPFTNFDFFFIKHVRAKVVQSLHLKDGGRALDLGCGGGASFLYLVRAVGVSGKVVGVDISPSSCVNARRRIASNGWLNVTVVESSAQKVKLFGFFDGALMFAAPDVYASESALKNILPHLNDGARIAIFGAKLSRSWIGRVLNPFFLFMCRNLSPATPLPDTAPWGLFANLLENINVHELFFGSMFVMHGTLKKQLIPPTFSLGERPEQA